MRNFKRWLSSFLISCLMFTTVSNTAFSANMTQYTATAVKPDVHTLALGIYKSAAITEDGSLYVWGVNVHGEVGNGSTEDQLAPVKVLSHVKSVSLGGYNNANGFTAAITEENDLYLWGYNSSGQIGNGTVENQLIPEKILEHVVSVQLGGSHSAAITEDGALYLWGENSYGQIGNGTTEAQLTPTKILDDVVSVSLGASHSAAVDKNGNLYLWGRNTAGQIGDGTTENKLTPVKILGNVASVNLKTSCSAALAENGDLYLWGENFYGQVGNGTTTEQLVPQKVMEDVATVKISGTNSAAITKNGDLYLWGSNSNGQIGNGQGGSAGTSTIKQLSPTKVLENVSNIAVSSENSAAITTDKNLYVWGSNFKGQIGNGDYGLWKRETLPTKRLSNVTDVELGDLHIAALTEGGDLYSWGFNVSGQVGEGTSMVICSSPAKVLSNVRLPDISYPGESEGEHDTFKIGIDNLGFSNSPDYFLTEKEREAWEEAYFSEQGSLLRFANAMKLWGYSGNIQISDEVINKLLYGKNNIVKQRIQDALDGVWGGSCFGMSSVMAIRFVQPSSLGIDEILPGNTYITNTFQLPYPNQSEEVENLVNYYQLIYNYSYYYIKEKYLAHQVRSDYTAATNTLIEKIEQGNVPVIACVATANASSAHAVILLDVLEEYESFYKVQVYDPNITSSFTEMMIFKDQILALSEDLEDSIQISYYSSANTSATGDHYTCLYNYLDSILEFDIRNYFDTDSDHSEIMENQLTSLLRIPVNTNAFLRAGNSTLNYNSGSVMERSGIYGGYPNISSLAEGGRTTELNFILEDTAEEYTIGLSPSESFASAKLELGTWAIYLSSNADIISEIDNTSKTVTLKSNSGNDCSLSAMIVTNDVTDDWPWYAVAIDTEDCSELTLTIETDGVTINGDGLENSTVSVKNDGEVIKQEIDTTSSEVKLINTDEGVVVEATEPDHTHTLSFIDSVDATCKATGLKSHWHCSDCGKNFLDEAGMIEIEDIVIPIDPTNHAGETQVRNAVEATYESEGYTGDTYCLGCGEKIASGSVIPKKNSGSSSSGGGGSSVFTYTIKFGDTDHGNITADHRQAEKGTIVTLTFSPDDGYELKSLTVLDRSNKEIKFEKVSETEYTFEMPQSAVTVDAVFALAAKETGPLPFTDVAEESWYYDAVRYVYENGLMSGISNTKFEPDLTTTRGMIVTILYRLEETPAVSDGSVFMDVEANQWYSDAIAWAAANNIVGGYGNGLFGPDDPITREQLAAILYRYAQYKGYDTNASADLSKYTDLEQLSEWAQEAVAWANGEGIINGTSVATLVPKGSATRAQVAAMLMRFCENSTV